MFVLRFLKMKKLTFWVSAPLLLCASFYFSILSAKDTQPLLKQDWKNIGKIELSHYHNPYLLRDVFDKQSLEDKLNKILTEPAVNLSSLFSQDDKYILQSVVVNVRDYIVIGSIIEKYQKANFDIDIKDMYYSNTPLLLAASIGNENAVEALINAGAKIDVKNRFLENLLHLSVHIKNKRFIKKIVRLFEQANLNIDEVDISGNTPLLLAALNSNKDAIEVLLEAGAKFDIKNKFGHHLLYEAAFGIKDKKFIKTLIEKYHQINFNIDAVDRDGNTPLLIAVLNGNKEAAELLIEAGAKIDVQSKSNESLLHLAAAKIEDKEFIRDLISRYLQKNCSIDMTNSHNDTALMFAIWSKNVIAAKALIEAKAKLDIQNKYDNNVLHLAAVKIEDKKFIKGLIKKYKKAGLKIDIPNQDGDTALMLAIRNQNIPAAEILIQVGAKLDIQNKYGENAFYLAAAKIENKKLLTNLIERYAKGGSKIDEPNQDGDTALMLAVCNKNIPAAEILIQDGAKLDIQNKHGENILHLSAANIENNDFINQVLTKKSEYSNSSTNIITNEDGKTVFQHVVENTSTVTTENFGQTPGKVENKNFINDLIKKYKQLNFSIDTTNADGNTALMLALKNKNLIAAKILLINAEAELDIQNKAGSTALHMAQSIRDKKIINAFIQRYTQQKLSFDTLDQDGNTPLLLAVWNKNKVATNALIKAGARLDISNKQGNDIFMLAKKYDYKGYDFENYGDNELKPQMSFFESFFGFDIFLFDIFLDNLIKKYCNKNKKNLH